MADTRWLTAKQQHAWRAFLAMDRALFRQLGRQLQRDSNLSSADYEVLVCLSEAPYQRLRLFELSQALQWEKSRLSHHLTRMEKRGLIAREECETDARGADIVLTPFGLDTIEAAAPLHVAEIRRVMMNALTAEQLETLAAISEAVAARIEADTSGR